MTFWWLLLFCIWEILLLSILDGIRSMHFSPLRFWTLPLFFGTVKHGSNCFQFGPFAKFCILVLQSGHNIEKVREKMRELTKQIVNFYSATKTLPYILEGLRSKNNRTRIECVDLVGFLIDHHGAEVQEGCFIFF